MTTPHHASNEGSPYVNFNVRYRDELDPVRAWRDATKTPMKAFTNFDGGGFNFYICEFETLKDAEAFRHHFQIHGEKTLWAEAADGSIHYLPDSKPAPDEATPGPISLRHEGFVPIKLGDLNLSQDEMELLARGSRSLFESDSEDEN